jgi:glycosyltransferase involved in cell wall biosynthesis
VGYAGSLRTYKGLDTLAAAARELSIPVTLVGARPGDPLIAPLQELAGGCLRLEPPLPPAAIPDRLAAFSTLVLPLSAGLFGERITSPLKLQDYLAAGRPIVGADLPTLHSAAPGAFHPYVPGDVASLVTAITEVEQDAALRSRLLAAASPRTWTQRAQELADFLDDALPGGGA